MQGSVIMAVIALLGYGLDGSLAQEAVKKLGSTRTIFWRGLLLSLVLGIAAFLYQGQTDTQSLIVGLLIAVLGYLPILAFYRALHTGKLGIIFPLSNSSALISVVLAAIFLGERFQAVAYLAMGLVIMGNIGLVLDINGLRKRKFIVNTGSLYALLACIGWGTVFFLYKFPTDALGPAMSAFLIEFGVWLAAGIHLVLSNTKPMNRQLKSQLPRLIGMVISTAIGVSLFTLALRKGPVSVVNSLVLASGSIGVLYGRIVKKEKLTLGQYAAAAMVITGIVLLGSIV